MPENGMPGPVCDLSSVRESVCIHTRKIFDSCRDKDCVEDLRFYPTASAMELLSGCQMVRGGTAELLYVYTDVEPVTFNRGFYSIDMRFFYRVTLQVGTGTPRCADHLSRGNPRNGDSRRFQLSAPRRDLHTESGIHQFERFCTASFCQQAVFLPGRHGFWNDSVAGLAAYQPLAMCAGWERNLSESAGNCELSQYIRHGQCISFRSNLHQRRLQRQPCDLPEHLLRSADPAYFPSKRA